MIQKGKEGNRAMNKIKVVILMKDPVAAEDLRQRLERMNCSIYETIGSVAQGLQRAQEIMPDLVFLDLMLKGEIDGMEAARYLRYTLGIPVVLLTGFANTRVFHLMRKMYPGLFLNRPVQDTELSEALELALDESFPLRSGVVLRNMEQQVSLLAN